MALGCVQRRTRQRRVQRRARQRRVQRRAQQRRCCCKCTPHVFCSCQCLRAFVHPSQLRLQQHCSHPHKERSREDIALHPIAKVIALGRNSQRLCASLCTMHTYLKISTCRPQFLKKLSWGLKGVSIEDFKQFLTRSTHFISPPLSAQNFFLWQRSRWLQQSCSPRDLSK